MRPEDLIWLIGFGFVALMVGAVILGRVMERRAAIDARPARRARLRAWAEKRGATYEEDVDLNPGVRALERVVLEHDGAEMVITTHDGGLLSGVTRVVAPDRWGRARAGSILYQPMPQDRWARRRPPFVRYFVAKGDALLDEETKRRVLALRPHLKEGHTVLQWQGRELVGRIGEHADPGPGLNGLLDLVAHVIACQPDEETVET